MSQKLRCAVVGATGVTGQEFLQALHNHPWFEVVSLSASSRSAGKTYREAIAQPSGLLSWYADMPLPEEWANMTVEDAREFDPRKVDLIFTAIESEPAKELEPKYAQHRPVISTASAFRMEADVPLLLPGLNMEHLSLLDRQRKQRGWQGFVLPNPNCTTVGLAYTLAPLHKAFGVKRVHMVSLQAISGAGRSPGVIGLDILDNIVPFIPKEEEKVASETQKILGTLDANGVVPAPFPISCTCTRVPVIEGHTEAVHVELAKPATQEQISQAWREFGAEFLSAKLPSAPPELLFEHEKDPFRPQVRLDRERNEGMTTVVGRLRPDPNLTNGWKYVLVSHNTKMGASKGCVLLAEHLRQKGYLGP